VPSRKGESAVVVPAPAAEPVVSTWRERFDSAAAQGMPAHITALYPFLAEARLTREVVARLRELCAEVPVLDVTFRRTARFPDVLYLDPEPAGGLRELTSAIAQRWPEAPPYGGIFDEVVPHLTVAHGADEDLLNDIEADVLRRLPVRTRLAEACLYVFDGERWRLRARLPFHAGLSEG
jgi:2'-5' RNA ligase